jgi:hypothetical protein
MDPSPIQVNSEGLDRPADLASRGRPSIALCVDARAILDHLAELSRPFGAAVEIAGESALIGAGSGPPTLLAGAEFGGDDRLLALVGIYRCNGATPLDHAPNSLGSGSRFTISGIGSPTTIRAGRLSAGSVPR